MNPKRTRTFTILLDVELTYDYVYTPDAGTTITSTGITPKGTALLRKAIREDASQMEIMERLADDTAEQLSLFEPEEDTFPH